MAEAVRVSKLRAVFTGNTEKHLTLAEAFYLGTKGGGAFFGKAGMGCPGSFEPGYDFDALVINDGDLAAPFELSILDRLERAVYLSDDRHIEAKYVKGVEM
jgi:guanine deaminase